MSAVAQGPIIQKLGNPFLRGLTRILLFITLAAGINALVYWQLSQHVPHINLDAAKEDLTPEGQFWFSMLLMSAPLGIVLVVFGLAWGALKAWMPFATFLAIGVGINLVFGLAVMQMPELKMWFLLTIPVGLILAAIGLIWSLKDDLVVRTTLRLLLATAFAVIVTLLFPFILIAAGLYVRKRRDLTFFEVWAQGPELYCFFIVNVYPIFFQVLPGLNLVRRKAREEAIVVRKKFNKVKAPVYHSRMDLESLQIGDVILTGKESWSNSIPIQASNLLSNGEKYRYWTHSAIYAGNGKVIEAQSDGRGVTETDLTEYFFKGGYKLMVLRHQFLFPHELEEVVRYCQDKQQLKCAYDVWGVSFYALASLIPPMLSGWLEGEFAEKFFNVRDSYFCSELVAEAFLAHGWDLFHRKSWRVKPLDFAFNPMFKEVDCSFALFAVDEQGNPVQIA